MNAINPKSARFSLTSTLALTLVLTLALTWVLSLRPVRLKIGDYYYIDQALNWYSKEVSQTSQITIKGELKDEFRSEL
jgi:hypothetical protein